jgi:hypothetical protein
VRTPSPGVVYSQRDLPNIDLGDRVDQLTEKEDLPEEVPTPGDGVRTFHVWRPKQGQYKVHSTNDVAAALGVALSADAQPLNVLALALVRPTQEVKPGKYLVDDRGRVRYFIDPTITGNLKERDTYVKPAKPVDVDLKDDLGKLTTRVTLANADGSLSVYRLWTNEKPKEEEAKEEDTEKKAEPPPYKADVPEGSYLVDDAGKVVYEVEGKKVGMKFAAPKTQVMAIIINGLLSQNLNWTMVLIGAFIAVTLELCGVSSLAFAVGLYVPMQYSVPIFCGGMVRWGVDAWSLRKSAAAAAGGTAEERAAAEVAAIAKTESSPLHRRRQPGRRPPGVP